MCHSVRQLLVLVAICMARTAAAEQELVKSLSDALDGDYDLLSDSATQMQQLAADTTELLAANDQTEATGKLRGRKLLRLTASDMPDASLVRAALSLPLFLCEPSVATFLMAKVNICNNCFLPCRKTWKASLICLWTSHRSSWKHWMRGKRARR